MSHLRYHWFWGFVKIPAGFLCTSYKSRLSLEFTQVAAIDAWHARKTRNWVLSLLLYNTSLRSSIACLVLGLVGMQSWLIVCCVTILLCCCLVCQVMQAYLNGTVQHLDVCELECNCVALYNAVLSSILLCCVILDHVVMYGSCAVLLCIALHWILLHCNPRLQCIFSVLLNIALYGILPPQQGRGASKCIVLHCTGFAGMDRLSSQLDPTILPTPFQPWRSSLNSQAQHCCSVRVKEGIVVKVYLSNIM